MKIKISKILSVFTFAILILFPSCKIKTTGPVKNPCQDEINKAKEENYIVGYGIGSHNSDASVARRKAKLRTDQDLNEQMERLVMGIDETFVSESSSKESSTIYIHTIAMNQIRLDEVICDETRVTKELNNNDAFMYKHHYAAKLDKNIVLNGIVSAIEEASEKSGLKVDFKKEKITKKHLEKLTKIIEEIHN